MNSLLSFVQQLVEPVLVIWPVWVLLLLAAVILFTLGIKAIGKYLLVLGVIVIAALLGLRGLLIWLVPVQDRVVTKEVSEITRNIPFYAEFSDGEYTIDSTEESAFKFESRESLQLHMFNEAEVPLPGPLEEYIPDDIQKALVLRPNGTVSLMTKHYGRGKLLIPKLFEPSQYYRFTNSNAKVDFFESKSRAAVITLIYSTIDATLPNTEQEYTFTLMGANNNSGRVILPVGPSYVINDKYHAIKDLPVESTIRNANTLDIPGTTKGKVLINIRLQIPGSLELLYGNQHNR